MGAILGKGGTRVKRFSLFCRDEESALCPQGRRS
jgi:hypothetical protein